MDKDQILVQMGVTQWRLRQPIAQPVEQHTTSVEKAVSAAESEVPAPPKQITPKLAPTESVSEISAPSVEPSVSIIEEAPLFNIRAVTVTANATSVAVGKNWVFVSASDDEDDAQQLRLFNNILKAINFASLAAAVQHDDRSAWLQGLQANQISLILMMGEAAATMTFPDKSAMPPYKLLPQQTLHTITPVLVLPSLTQLLEQPKQKREVWTALQEAINLSQ